MKQSEKTLVGIALLAGGIGLVVGLGLPQWDAFSQNNDKITTLKSGIESLTAEKQNLGAQVELLRKNTAVPPDINIKTYTEQTREKVIKQLLDQVVGLATKAGNKFISLAPVETDPMITVQGASTDSSKGVEGDKKAEDQGSNSGDDADKNKDQAVEAPLINTFGYDLSVRGSYDTVQQFLKSLSGRKELLEVTVVRLENELGGQQGSGVSTDKMLTDPNLPIRLTATIRLGLQPVSE